MKNVLKVLVGLVFSTCFAVLVFPAITAQAEELGTFTVDLRNGEEVELDEDDINGIWWALFDDLENYYLGSAIIGDEECWYYDFVDDGEDNIDLIFHITDRDDDSIYSGYFSASDDKRINSTVVFWCFWPENWYEEDVDYYNFFKIVFGDENEFDLGELTIDLTEGDAFFSEGDYETECEYSDFVWLMDYLMAYYSLDDEENEYYLGFDDNDSVDMVMSYTEGEGITFSASDTASLNSYTVNVVGEYEDGFIYFGQEYYSSVTFILKNADDEGDDNNDVDDNNNDNNNVNNDNNNNVNNNNNENNNNDNNNNINNNNNEEEGNPDDNKSEPPVFGDLKSTLDNAIENAKGGNKQIITYKSYGDALPADIIQKLKDNPNVTLVYIFWYNGHTYRITINAKNIVILKDTPWYGPDCMSGSYPTEILD